MPGANEFDTLFGGGGSPAPQRRPTGGGMPALGGASAGGQQSGGMSNPAARAVLERFVAFAQEQGWSTDQMVEFIMSVLVAQAQQMGQKPPEEGQVRQLIAQFAGPSGTQQGMTPTPEASQVPPQGGGGMPPM